MPALLPDCMSRVHPRSRGAACYAAGGVAELTGPSPLTRGSRDQHPQRGREPGSIPAHAGQPATSRRWARACRVHPRSRGAAKAKAGLDMRDRGPSPLTRGSQRPQRQGKRFVGSIPAHAGQPVVASQLRQPRRVHPRSRGAAFVGSRRVGGPWGPSPLTRGSLQHDSALGRLFRSIPAHAGQPASRVSRRSVSWVHPRSRGAAPNSNTSPTANVGPSPLTRGSRQRNRVVSGASGSIPAHAGQPHMPRNSACVPRVHPRSRGAALGTVQAQHAGLGSIPAHAGQPTPAALGWHAIRVHPRSRGAADEAAAPDGILQGPSPLTRGSPQQAHGRDDQHGSIPAHAGQPHDNPKWALSHGVHPRSRGAAW